MSHTHRAIFASGSSRKRECASLQFADVVVNVGAYRVYRGGQELALPPTEYQLLCFFLRNPMRVFSRVEIIAAVWPENPTIDERTVDVHIARLRRCLAQDGRDRLIRTVRKVGYSLG